MQAHLELVIIVALLVYAGVKDWVYMKREKAILDKFGFTPTSVSKVIPEQPLGRESVMTEEKADEILRKELGDAGYKQLITDQNYGGIG